MKINSKKWYNKNKEKLSIYYKNKSKVKLELKNKLKKCQICNNNFYSIRNNKLFCSKECSNKQILKLNRIRDNTPKRILYFKNYNNTEKARETRKKYYCSKVGKETQRKKHKEYYYNDILFNLSHKTRIRIGQLLRKNNYSKDTKSIDCLGCSIIELKQHLENQFTLGMTWKNYGWGWHIDHIKPLSSASSKDELYKLFHYSNLQPLWARDNLIKSNKLLK